MYVLGSCCNWLQWFKNFYCPLCLVSLSTSSYYNCLQFLYLSHPFSYLISSNHHSNTVTPVDSSQSESVYLLPLFPSVFCVIVLDNAVFCYLQPYPGITLRNSEALILNCWLSAIFCFVNTYMCQVKVTLDSI